ncbi:hypothetical protein C0Q70_16843 [Pomacea canaliculata]|uniref:ZP domain-containing protein n=1 Tax=Pomacea canaliculata TaxID=400727 RepID=A0A2T7NQX2_POMCA|nr:hypothetical protein C0Q70_16843 [Pomacea canaliculata]
MACCVCVCVLTCLILVARTEGAAVGNSDHWPAGVTYTCVDTAREGRNVLITIDPEDRHYDDVESSRRCGERPRPVPRMEGRAVLARNQQYHHPREGRDPGRRLMWRSQDGTGDTPHLRLRRQGGTRDKHQHVQGSDLTTVSDSGDWGQEVLVDSPEIIALEFVDPVSGDVLTEAPPTSDVRLRMSLIVGEEDLMEVVSPFNCVASSIDGQYGEQLTDDKGFQTFLSNETSKAISASALESRVIYKEGENCALLVAGADVASDVEDKRSQSMSHPDPFLYLNPITCSLFLILLTVFLILYVAFLRSLRRSIEDMKREIEAQRSRDKFLVM